jgi:hypothetical protein
MFPGHFLLLFQTSIPAPETLASTFCFYLDKVLLRTLQFILGMPNLGFHINLLLFMHHKASFVESVSFTLLDSFFVYRVPEQRRGKGRTPEA